MMEFYPQIKAVHVYCVLLSVALFSLRALALMAGQRWPRAQPVRWLSWGIDTTLLTAALMLATILPGALFANHWLTVKLVFLVAYVVLGHRCLAAGTAKRMRPLWFIAALACYAFMYSVARSHHPAGIFWPLLA